MPHHDLAALAREAIAAWNSHDPSRVAAIAADDIVIEGDALAAPIRDREAFRQFAQIYMDAFSDLRFEFREPLVIGDTVVTEWHSIGTHDGPLMGIAPTGRTGSVNGCTVDEYRDGKVVRQRVYWDSATLFRQLGAEAAAGVHTPAAAMEAVAR